MSTTVSNQVPENVAGLGDLMSTYPGTWALCGGWAVDAWLGRVTRKHGDVDVVVFDQAALLDYLPGWQLLAHDPLTPEHHAEWWTGQRALSDSSHIHARPPERSGALPAGGIATDEGGFNLEFYIGGRAGDDWVLSRTPRISVPLVDSIRESPWRVPAAVPEVLLFYKAHEPRQRDRLDFAALSPSLEGEQREWLRTAIEVVGHPWVARLSD